MAGPAFRNNSEIRAGWPHSGQDPNGAVLPSPLQHFYQVMDTICLSHNVIIMQKKHKHCSVWPPRNHIHTCSCSRCFSTFRYLMFACAHVCVYGRFFGLYHNAVSSRVKELAFEDLEANEIVSLLTWVLNTYKRYFYLPCLCQDLFFLIICKKKPKHFRTFVYSWYRIKLWKSKHTFWWIAVFLTVFFHARKIHQPLCEVWRILVEK